MLRFSKSLLSGALVFILIFSFSLNARSKDIVLKLQDSYLRLQVVTPSIVRVTISPTARFSKRQSLSVIRVNTPCRFSTKENGNFTEVKTDLMSISISKKDGAITFSDNNGSVMLKSAPKDNSSLVPATVQGENAYHVKQGFVLSKEEGIFGLGQYEDGIMNYRGHDVIIIQANRVSVNPFLVSSKGYGILWDNYSRSLFHDGSDGTFLSSDVADEIDYYFVAGSKIDDAIAGYRALTGKAPMFGKYAYGYWQSKERYMNSDELFGIVKEYRKREVPLDNVIQDWQYWGEMDYFSGMCWDSVRFKNPKAMMDSIHQNNAHAIATIWPAFGVKSEIYKDMQKHNLLFTPPHWCGGKVYDAYNPEARKIYWKHLKKALFDNNIDGYWMDGSEPEFRCTDDRFGTALNVSEYGKNYLGTAERYINPYSLVHTKGVYEGQRSVSNDKRVFILTRSAFSGQQRYGSATWSGDIFASFQTLKDQIAAGLNFNMSGIPYWTTDIGAFITSFKYPEGVKDDAYKELYVRWFQFGAFCPLFRSHGTNTPREVWQFGDKGSWAYDALVKADKLRYRLMPYIYSTAWKATHDDYTMMRALPMDFATDANTFAIGSEFMFGPSILVAPVTKEMNHKAQVKGDDIQSNRFFAKDGTENGLSMEIYRGTEFNKLVLNRKFDASQLGWNGCLPQSLDTAYSLKMEGRLLSDNKGQYTFKVITDGGVKLWIDNKLLIDRWENKKKNEFFGDITLEAGTKYDFRVEHRQPVANDAFLKINWIKPALADEDTKTFDVYLPKDNDWFDFWTGRTVSGGQTVKTDSPIDIIPLFVPAGSVIPMGPHIQYAMEKKGAPIEIRVFPGKDGSFTIYEDEGDGYNYEKGVYSTIPLKWDNAAKTLVIGKRQGKYPGMVEAREFNIVIVKENHGIGLEQVESPDKVVKYDGKEVKVSF